MTRRALGVVAGALTVLSLLAGCAPSSSSLTATELTAGMQPAEAGSLSVSEGTQAYDFALDLLRQSADGENVLVSPLSVLSALAMTENGADGETLAQMEQVTGIRDEGSVKVIETAGRLTEALTDGEDSLEHPIYREYFANAAGLDEESYEMLMGKNAKSLFRLHVK